MGDFHNQEKRKARKEHICDCCQSKIIKGEEYEYSSGVNCGDFYTYKLCSYCQIIVNKEFSTGYYDDGINIENLLSDLEFNEEYIKIYRPKRNKSLWLRHVLACWEKDFEIFKLKATLQEAKDAVRKLSGEHIDIACVKLAKGDLEKENTKLREALEKIINSECRTGCRRDSEECTAENCILREFIDIANQALEVKNA